MLLKPVTIRSKGSRVLCCTNAELNEVMPMISDMDMIAVSNIGSANTSKPNNGSMVIIKGNKAQCMAHSSDTPIPILSI